MTAADIILAFAVLVLLLLYVLDRFDDWWVRRRKAKAPALSLAVDDPTPPDPPAEALEDWGDVLPVRVAAIDVPRVGVVHPVHYDCADHWFDRRPSLVCADCLPVLRERSVA